MNWYQVRETPFGFPHQRCGKHGEMPCPTHLWFVEYKFPDILLNQELGGVL